MAKISGNRFASVIVLAAFLSPLFCTATPVGAGVRVKIKNDNPVQRKGKVVKDRAGLAGCYDLAGVDTHELPYSGTFCIEVLGDLLYELTWTLMEEDEGLVVYTGRGVSMGDDLFAVWRESGTDYDCFLHLFEIDSADGTLNGLRINMSGTTSSQTATPGGSGVPLDWSEAGQLAGSFIRFPSTVADSGISVSLSLKTTIHRTVLKIGYGVTLHRPRTLYTVVEIYTSARDKFACHPHFIFNRLSLQFKNHQGVVGLVMDIEALSPGNTKFIGSFSFHGLLLSYMFQGTLAFVNSPNRLSLFKRICEKGAPTRYHYLH